MIGAGGVIPPPDGYWPAVERICRERDVLLIADEVISGFGRLGRWFGCERYGFTPDLMTCAKGISSGYVPLGAVVVAGRVREPFWRRRRGAVRPRRHLRGPPGRVRRGAREPRHPRARATRRARRDARAGARASSSRRSASLAGVADVRSGRPRGRRRARRRPARRSPGAGCGRRRSRAAPGRRSPALLRGVALQISPPFVVTEAELAADRRRRLVGASARSSARDAA